MSHTTYTRIDFLNYLLQYIPQKSVCAEIGVLRGDFSELINTIITPRSLYLIDPWIEGYDKNSDKKYKSGLQTAYSTESDLSVVMSRFLTHIQNQQVVIKRGFSYDFVNTFPDSYFDFIYIDATHLYESVKADINMYLPKLKNNGVLAGHDYINVDNFGVIAAVDESVITHQLTWICKSESSDWALMKAGK
jgi:hypothetical protein